MQSDIDNKIMGLDIEKIDEIFSMIDQMEVNIRIMIFFREIWRKRRGDSGKLK
jgi:hypothetical protein